MGVGGYGVPYFFVLARTIGPIPFSHNNNLMVVHQCQVPQLGRSQGGLSNATSFYQVCIAITPMCHTTIVGWHWICVVFG